MIVDWEFRDKSGIVLKSGQSLADNDGETWKFDFGEELSIQEGETVTCIYRWSGS